MMNTQTKNSKQKQSITTISGLDIETSSTLIHIVSAMIGIFVFYFVPILANFLDKPITAVILNVIPNSLILAFFIVESTIEPYLFASVFSPIINVIDNIISYVLYVYFKLGPAIALWSNVILWVLVVFISYFI